MNKINNSDFIMKPKNDYVFKRIFGDERNSAFKNNVYARKKFILLV